VGVTVFDAHVLRNSLSLGLFQAFAGAWTILESGVIQLDAPRSSQKKTPEIPALLR